MLPKTTILLLCSGLLSAALGAEPPSAGEAARPAAKMKMDESMTTGMMKPGMKKGDVKKAATMKKKKMQPMLEDEQKSMPPPAAKQ